MTTQKSSLKKVLGFAGLVAMTISFIAVISFKANAVNAIVEPPAKTHDCIYWDAQNWFDCSFDSNECATKSNCHVGG
jgi:hypothetical protein